MDKSVKRSIIVYQAIIVAERPVILQRDQLRKASNAENELLIFLELSNLVLQIFSSRITCPKYIPHNFFVGNLTNPRCP